eukprot:gene13352-17908_t
MTSIDDIWRSMNEDNLQPKVVSIGSKEAKPKKLNKKSSNKPSIDEGKSIIESVDTIPELVNYNDMKAKLNRSLASLIDTDHQIRRKSIVKIHKLLFLDYSLTDEDYCELFHDIFKPIFKLYCDPVEKCREMACKITSGFYQKCSNVIPVLAYYFPALLSRIPPGQMYDEEMKIFVSDVESHEQYRRGVAVDRQDKGGATGLLTHHVIEVSEEIRLLLCTTLHSLISKIVDLRSYSILHPYFHDIIIYLQSQLHDPYHELKIIACKCLEILAKVHEFEIGMKFFSVGLVRAILPVLRHRHSKVRVIALSCLDFVMTVPDHAKLKASGSEAISDLAGFREENVLQIAAFYKPDVQINYLAELVQDKSLVVREKLAEFLTKLLTEIKDRYDHQTRLLPYLLDLLTDENESVSSIAMKCLQICGMQYEEEHQNEIIERRQYGVDGNELNNFNNEKLLPYPFDKIGRPRIGIRLYVRGNTKRFLNALINELTNWVAPTRMKSANLLKIIVILCEEHLTMETHVLFPALIKACRFAKEDSTNDKDKIGLYHLLLEIFELLGRYIQPEVYIYYLLPRLRGDVDVVTTFGIDTNIRIIILEILNAMLSAMNTMSHNNIDEASFLLSGRLSTIKKSQQLLFRYLLIHLSSSELNESVSEAMELM